MLLEVVGVKKQPPLSIVRFRNLVQLFRLRRIRNLPLRNSSHNNLQQRGQRASSRFPEAIEGASDEEDEYSGSHHSRENDISRSPANVVLNVDNHSHPEQQAAAEAQVPPVEEGHLLLPFLWMVVVELVGSEALHRRLVAAGSDRDQVYREEEDDLVDPARLRTCALAAWLQRWDHSGHCQQKQPLFFLNQKEKKKKKFTDPRQQFPVHLTEV